MYVHKMIQKSHPCATPTTEDVFSPLAKMVMSFDVGIKNMSFCVIKQESQESMIDWQILNLVGDTNDTRQETKCSRCSRKALYIHPRNHELAYCKTHANSTGCLFPEKKYSVSFLKSRRITELTSLIEELNILEKLSSSMDPIEISIRESLSHPRKSSLLEGLTKYLACTCLTMIKKPIKVSAKQVDLIRIARNMTMALDKLPYIHTITNIIIENQISPIATRMKAIQGMLTQYFVMKCPNASIEYISASNKLKDLMTSEEPTNYRKNKEMSIKFTEEILQETTWSVWKPAFVGTKRDDLADCFLQYLWWSKRKILSV